MCRLRKKIASAKRDLIGKSRLPKKCFGNGRTPTHMQACNNICAISCQSHRYPGIRYIYTYVCLPVSRMYCNSTRTNGHLGMKCYISAQHYCCFTYCNENFMFTTQMAQFTNNQDCFMVATTAWKVVVNFLVITLGCKFFRFYSLRVM